MKLKAGTKSPSHETQRAFIFSPLSLTSSSITHHFLWGEEVCQESEPLVEPIRALFKKTFPVLIPRRVKYVPMANKNLRGGFGIF